MSGPVILHEYRWQNDDCGRRPCDHTTEHVPYEETLCMGRWYTTGTAPCELMTQDDAKAIALDIPDCEPEDLAAVAELLGQPKVSVCRAKGRASWDDKNLPDHTQWCRTHGELWRKTAEGCDVGLRKGTTKDCSTGAAAQAGVITASDIIKAMEKM